MLGLLAAVACGDGGDAGPDSTAGEAARPTEEGRPAADPPRSDPEPVPGLADPGAMVPARQVQGEPGPSFDCDEAVGTVEELICADAELAALDRRLDTLWQEALRAMDDGDMPEADQAAVRAGQRGWIEGRNDCWKADDVRDCVLWMYRMRLPRLEADYGLAPGGEPTFWACAGNPANEFVLTFFQTDPPSVRVERGDRQETMVAVPAASGARYTGTFGREVWVKGDEGTFIWPQGDTLRCVLRSRGGG